MLIRVTIQGVSPLLMHRFNQAAAESLENKGRRAHSGEKLSPREQAEAFAYQLDDGRFYIPGAAMFKAIVQAGKLHKHGKNKLTTNATSLIPGALWMHEDSIIAIPLEGVTDFEIDSRKIINPNTGQPAICHRPIFYKWRATFRVCVDEDFFSERQVRELIDTAGKRIGICAFRPEKKGPFGRFVAKEWHVEIEAQPIAA